MNYKLETIKYFCAFYFSFFFFHFSFFEELLKGIFKSRALCPPKSGENSRKRNDWESRNLSVNRATIIIVEQICGIVKAKPTLVLVMVGGLYRYGFTYYYIYENFSTTPTIIWKLSSRG